jgi:hypothetical protein
MIETVHNKITFVYNAFTIGATLCDQFGQNNI